MFSTAEYTGTGDTSSGLCMFLFARVIVHTSTKIPKESECMLGVGRVSRVAAGLSISQVSGELTVNICK